MKQVFQNLKNGQIDILETPCPEVKNGNMLIRTSKSLISSGTERMLVEFGRANLLDKARQQPDKVRQALNKIKTDGLIPTIEAIQSKLDQPLPMGYCNAGVVIKVGKGVENFSAGDRVVSNGPHAEVACVPCNLCAKIPEGVDDETATFTPLGAIALHGVRLAAPTLGERFVVYGLGLIGLLAIQLLRANGCQVLGVDIDPEKVEIAKRVGAEAFVLSLVEDPVREALIFSNQYGVDGVLITASTKSNEPIRQAAQMSRKRGRIILVGVTGLEISRSDFYEKELSFQVSCSYGPGRHDVQYEEKGNDYPIGYVRWTEQRNFQTIVEMMEKSLINVLPLISRELDFHRAKEAYQLLESDKTSLGIILSYPLLKGDRETDVLQQTILSKSDERKIQPVNGATACIGFIGSGNYATRVLIPAFKKAGARLKTVASTGVSCGYAARKFGFEKATTNVQELINDDNINTIVIATRHDSHAEYVCKALKRGKHVFVEKPLSQKLEEVEEIESLYRNLEKSGHPPSLAIGFNRRFAPHVVKIKSLLEAIRQPKSLIVVVNAGAIPEDHWIQDPSVGGGRIVGEACHFIDVMRFLIDSPVRKVNASFLREKGPKDKMAFTLEFIDGSIGTVHYLSNGHAAYPKERLEIFCGGKILVLDNFKKLQGYGWSDFNKMKLLRQDKGHDALVNVFIQSIKNDKKCPISFEEILETTKLSFEIAKMAEIA